MRNIVILLASLGVLVPFLAAAPGCSDNGDTRADAETTADVQGDAPADAADGDAPGEAGDEAPGDTATEEGDTAPGDTTADTDDGLPTALPFQPSNLADPVDFAGLSGDLVFEGANCGNLLNFVAGKAGCDEPGTTYRSFEAEQADGSKVMVFAARNIRIEQATQVQVRGSLPIVLVALGDVDVIGTLDAAGRRATAVGGGYPGALAVAVGNGPGGGGWDTTNRAGGAGYCGIGGESGGGTAGGTSYGNETLVPLVGGSSGGGLLSGAGGGAVQIVAGNRVRLAGTGVVHVGGGGGDSSGGGAGGSILVEAPEVVIAGILAANGGGGAAGRGPADGQDGLPSGTAAAGGADPDTAVLGGTGGAGTTIDGGDGVPDTQGLLFHGYGGGAVGRIRINAGPGGPDISGTLSPASTTPCATIGTLPAP